MKFAKTFSLTHAAPSLCDVQIFPKGKEENEGAAWVRVNDFIILTVGNVPQAGVPTNPVISKIFWKKTKK